MSEKTRKAEQRRLRKAVGDDAMALMAAMSGILNESVFPLQQQHGEQLRELTQRLETLEGMVKALAKRLSEPHDVWQPPPDPPNGHGPSAFAVDGQERVGAEVV